MRPDYKQVILLPTLAEARRLCVCPLLSFSDPLMPASSLIDITFYRDGGHADDSYPGAVYLTSFDLHLRVSDLGTINEGTRP